MEDEKGIPSSHSSDSFGDHGSLKARPLAAWNHTLRYQKQSNVVLDTAEQRGYPKTAKPLHEDRSNIWNSVHSKENCAGATNKLRETTQNVTTTKSSRSREFQHNEKTQSTVREKTKTSQPTTILAITKHNNLANQKANSSHFLLKKNCHGTVNPKNVSNYVEQWVDTGNSGREVGQIEVNCPPLEKETKHIDLNKPPSIISDDTSGAPYSLELEGESETMNEDGNVCDDTGGAPYLKEFEGESGSLYEDANVCDDTGGAPYLKEFEGESGSLYEDRNVCDGITYWRKRSSSQLSCLTEEIPEEHVSPPKRRKNHNGQGGVSS